MIGVVLLDIVDRIFNVADAKFKDQREFAAAVGVAPSVVSAWRCRKSASYVKRLEKVAAALGVTVQELLFEPSQADVSNSDTEAQLIAAYRRADERTQTLVRLALGLD